MATAQEFAAALRAEGARTPLQIDRFLRRVAFEVFTRVVRRTPVDTGRARLSWNIARNQADESVAPENPSQGRRALTTSNQKLTRIRPDKRMQPIHISNNLEYIRFLEEGSSTQAPQGMVAITLAEVQRLRQ